MDGEGLGELIRRRREEAGRTREQQAIQFQQAQGGRWFDPDRLKRWEVEKRLPPSAAQELIAKVYDLPLSAVQQAVAISRRRRDGAVDAANAVADGHVTMPGLPWDQLATVSTLSDLAYGGSVDRRAFVAASGASLLASASQWRAAFARPRLLIATGRRQVTPGIVDHLDRRLDHLRHLDDELGGGELTELAYSEFGLITKLLRDATYTEQTGRRLYAVAAEASRIVAWTYFDTGQHGAAHRFFEAALRASATAADPVTGAYVMSFQAVQCYSTQKADTAIELLDCAREAIKPRATPLMTAMLAARTARSYSKLGDRRACAHALHQARTALDRGPRDDDPATLYWVTEGEIEMIAGSSALELNDPAEALRRFEAALIADYRGDDQFPRTHAIYMARAAEAHLALHDLDAAVDRAHLATRCLGGVDSARSSSTITGLRKKLAAHAASPTVRDFLDATR